MKLPLVLAGLLALSACARGADPDECADAQTALAIAEAALAVYPDQAELAVAVASAKAALPAFCPAPTVVAVPVP